MWYSGTDQSVLLKDTSMPLKSCKIIKAAEELFLGHRYDEVTLEQVAERAGVGKGTIYRYFRSKEDLYYRILLSALDELIESLNDVNPNDNGTGLKDIVGNFVDFYTRRGSAFAILQAAQLHHNAPPANLKTQWQKKHRRMIALLASRMKIGMEAGSYKTDLKPEAAALLLLGMVRTALSNPDAMPETAELSTTLVRLFENGISSTSTQQSGQEGN